jgi:hypothetical protein
MQSAQADFVPFVAAERTQFATDRWVRICTCQFQSTQVDFVPFVAAVSNRW